MKVIIWRTFHSTAHAIVYIVYLTKEAVLWKLKMVKHGNLKYSMYMEVLCIVDTIRSCWRSKSSKSLATIVVLWLWKLSSTRSQPSPCISSYVQNVLLVRMKSSLFLWILWVECRNSSLLLWDETITFLGQYTGIIVQQSPWILGQKIICGLGYFLLNDSQHYCTLVYFSHNWMLY